VIKDQIVRAGAGAGKTTWLTQQVFELADAFSKEHSQLPKIVVTTFTRKATQELRERLVLKACEEQRPDLIKYVSSQSQLFITTIHGVLANFVRTYGHLMGFDNDFQILTEQGSVQMSKRILKSLSEEGVLDRELLEQFGFDKLLNLSRRYYEFWLQCPDGQSVEIEDLRSALRAELSEYARGFKFLSSAIQGQAEDQKWLDYGSGLDRIGTALMQQTENPAMVAQEEIGRLGRKPSLSKKDPQIDPELDDQLKTFMKDAKAFLSDDVVNTSLWPDYLNYYSKFRDLMMEFCPRFIEEKQLLGQFEMVDLELLVYKSLRDYPQLAEDYSELWDHWLVDEFQDTSPIQVQLIGALSQGKPMYVVGDPQQSIYLFRGANSKVFDLKEKEIISSGGKATPLRKNYRSEPELLEFFNDFFKDLGTQFNPMQPREVPSDPKKIVSEIALIEPGDESKQNENKAIADRILRLNSQGVGFEEICILARTNKSLEEISAFLNEYNIPTRVHAASGFYQRQEVIDAMFLIKFLVNPHDDFSLVGLLRSPWVECTDQQIYEWVSESNEKSLYSFLVQNEQVPVQLKEYQSVRKEEGIVQAFARFILETDYLRSSRIYDPTGRRESNILKLLHILSEEETRPGFNILDFITHKEMVQDSMDSSSESDAVAAVEPKRVNLMTIHASKGLKFNHVIVPFLHKRPSLTAQQDFVGDTDYGKWAFSIPIGEDSKFKGNIFSKSKISQLREREILENDRLLYVALTRAAQSVFLSFVENPQTLSWAQRMQLNLDKETVHMAKYSYQVLRGPWEVTPLPVEGSKSDSKQNAPYAGVEEAKDLSLSTYSVSSLLEDSAMDKAKGSQPAKEVKPLAPLLAKTAKGTLIHRLMETLKVDFNFDFESVAQDWFGDEADEALNAIDYVRGLQDPPLKEIIHNGHVEWGFQLLTKEGIMEGQIDLWGLDAKGNVWLVDYKSGQEKYKAKAFEQLKIYAQALRAKGIDKEINLAVIYPMSQSVFTSTC
tara:strand:- start:59646 stop:62657 length:3012 start_codon:yes stop_codon:yes gene_type:complete